MNTTPLVEASSFEEAVFQAVKSFSPADAAIAELAVRGTGFAWEKVER